MLFGIDIHPEFQAGLSIEQAVSEGIGFLSVKVSEGTDSSYLAMGSADWIRRAKALGIPVVAYHYLRPGNETAQAQVFAAALRTAGCPGVLDAEAVQVINGITTPTLTISGIRAFVTAARVAGANIALLYLPRWYHALLGAPLLAGLPPLWGSAYVSGVTGPPAVQYAAASARGWTAYGGKDVAVLQFTDRATVAGMALDANAYLGTRAQFAALLGAPLTKTQENTVENFRVAGNGVLPLICPTGKTSAMVAAAWVSAIVDGPTVGHVRFWFQDDTAGISDVARDITFANGHSQRQWVPVPDGTTMIRVEYAVGSGGTIALETLSK